jgi:hypothetical protein
MRPATGRCAALVLACAALVLACAATGAAATTLSIR